MAIPRRWWPRRQVVTRRAAGEMKPRNQRDNGGKARFAAGRLKPRRHIDRRVVSTAVVYAPMPTKAACPNDICPATPVSRTSRERQRCWRARYS